MTTSPNQPDRLLSSAAMPVDAATRPPARSQDQWLVQQLDRLGLAPQQATSIAAAMPQLGPAIILVVDDTPANLQVLEQTLAPLGHQVHVATDGPTALLLARRLRPELILLDVTMPEMDGIEVCRRLKMDPDLRLATVLLCTDDQDHAAKHRGLSLGAADVVTRTYDPQEIVARVTTHLAVQRLVRSLVSSHLARQRELAAMRAENHEALQRLDWILIGCSAPLRQLRAQIASAANGPDAVLLRARSDCGAEAVARSIHAASSRRSAPFITIDGARLSSITREGEISPFSTGGLQPSRLELADGGVLFIEHLERLPHQALEQLAAYVESMQGARRAERTPTPDVQLIAVTSLPDGITFPATFPAPVVETLQMQQIRVPSLGERRDDIVSLAEAILQRQSEATGRELNGFDAASITCLRAHTWPGNLRELRDVVLRASAACTTGVVTVDPAMVQSGVRLGGYHLIRRLGAGGFGEVWEARHQLLARPAAVKVMRGDHKDDLELLERFRREAAATASLASQHTVILYDFGVSEQGQFYHVMELLDGLDLDRLCERHGPPPPERLARFLLHACRSLAEAHARGMIHRDIKPSNLFTCRLGLEVDVLKVLDFGLVRRTDVPQRRLTQENFVVGTPDYMAPEAAADDGRIEPRTDIYSLAASAWSMCAGRSLFTAAAPMAVLVAHVRETPKDLLSCAPHVPKVLSDLIMAGLAKDPADRPTASELGRALIATGLPQAWNERLRRQWWDEYRPATRNAPA